MYTDKIAVSNSNVTELLYASDKYMLTMMKQECEKTLKKSATSEYAAKTLQAAYKYHLPDVLQESLQYIELKTNTCLLSKHALNLPKECVDMIVKSDFLSCTETYLCDFFLKWAKAQCVLQSIESTGQNMRNLVGQTLYQIRFPVVDMDYFSKEIANTELLSRDEIIAIYRSQYGINTSNFTNNKRGGSVKNRPEHTVRRYTKYKEVKDEREKTEALNFQSDTNIWLKGVHLFSYDYNVNLKILDATTEKILFHTAGIDWDYKDAAHLIKLPKPVQILSGKEYTLLTIQKYTYGMCKGVQCNHSVKASDCDVSITFKNSTMCTGITNVNQGQFPGFTFSV